MFLITIVNVLWFPSRCCGSYCEWWMPFITLVQVPECPSASSPDSCNVCIWWTIILVGDAPTRWKSDLTLLWPASLPSQTSSGLHFFICIQSTQLQKPKQFQWSRQWCSIWSSGFVRTQCMLTQHISWSQQLSSSIFTSIFSTDMIDRLKYCYLYLSTEMFFFLWWKTNGFLKTNKQTKSPCS